MTLEIQLSFIGRRQDIFMILQCSIIHFNHLKLLPSDFFLLVDVSSAFLMVVDRRNGKNLNLITTNPFPRQR